MLSWGLFCFLPYLTSVKGYDFDSFEDFCFDIKDGKCDTDFVAFLYNPRTPSFLCLGALITDHWVIDHCVDEPGFTYERVWLGARALHNFSVTDSIIYSYIIATHVIHKQYYRLNFRINENPNEYVYAAINTISLHKTEERVLMIPNVIRTIEIYPKIEVPEKGDVIFMGKLKLERVRLTSVPRNTCDEHFQKYFTPNEKILLSERQNCFKTNSITPEMCCQSYGLLLYEGKLAGIMGWSTVCSQKFGVDPWIFTYLIFYRSFIRNETNLEQYIATSSFRRTTLPPLL